MTLPGDQPVASGQSYTVTVTVTEVDGHRATDLTEFIGATAITLLRDGHGRRLIGDDSATSGTIRFHQKDPGPDDKDVRVWAITDPRRRYVPRPTRRILLKQLSTPCWSVR